MSSQIGCFVAHLLLFCRLSLSVIVWAPERLNWSPALSNGKCENFAIMTSFDLQNIDLGSPNLHLKEFLYGPTYPPYFVFLALTGAEIAGGRFCQPPPGRVILRPSPGSVLRKGCTAAIAKSSTIIIFDVFGSSYSIVIPLLV